MLTKAYAILPSVHSAGLGNQRDFITVLVTNHSKNELLGDYARSVSGILLHLADLRYSIPELSRRDIIEVGMVQYGTYQSQPQHTTGSKSDYRSPYGMRRTDSSGSHSGPPLSLAEIKRLERLGVLPISHRPSAIKTFDSQT